MGCSFLMVWGMRFALMKLSQSCGLPSGSSISTFRLIPIGLLPKTSNCECACWRNAGNVFPATAGKQSRHISRHVRDACAVMHAGIANSFFPWIRRREKRSRNSRRIRNPQYNVSGKRPMGRGTADKFYCPRFHCNWHIIMLYWRMYNSISQHKKRGSIQASQ